MKQLFFFFTGLVLLFAVGAKAAEPLQEMGAASGLPAADASALKRGEIVSARGTKGSFARGVYVESLFFVRKPPAVVGNALLQWDPSKHPEDEVAAYQLFRPPATADFTRVARLKPGNGTDRWILEQSAAEKAGRQSELHLTPAEAAIFRAEPGGASAAWERVLRARADAVAAGGLAAAPAYTAAGVTIAPQAELRSLLGMAPAIGARFAEVAETGPASKAERAFYAERSLTQGHTSFSLAAFNSRPTPESWRIMDCTYYTSDTYFMSVDLYELWAWEGGTLVWQIDFVDAPFRSYTHGLDKLFAGREILKEATESIRNFRQSVEP